MGTAEGSSHFSQKRNTLTLLWTTTLPCSNTAAARLPTNIPSSPAVPQELPHTFCFIVNNSSKMVNAKLGFVVILRRNIVGVKLVLGVQLVQHGGICTLCMHEKIWHLAKAIPIETIFQSIAHFFLAFGDNWMHLFWEMIRWRRYVKCRNYGNWLNITGI